MTTAKEFKELFTELYNSGEEIINNNTKEVFSAADGEEFRQCWADTATRRNFPKYWFVSEAENLLSVRKDKIVWLNKNRRKNSNKISYKFAIQTDEGAKIKNIEAHNLVGLVWGSEAFGLAAKLLEEKGLEAFGVNNSEENVVQGHHKSKDDTDNRPENIKFLTDKVHVVIGKAPHPDAAVAKHFEYMDDLGEVMTTENPDAITIVLDGHIREKGSEEWINCGVYDVISVDNIRLSPEAAAQLQALGIAIN